MMIKERDLDLPRMGTLDLVTERLFPVPGVTSKFSTR